MEQGVNPILLVVDDEKEIREMVRLALVGKYTVVGAKSAEDALILLDIRKPDVLLTDVNMEGTSGVELLETLKLQGVPVVIMSGRFGRGDNLPETVLMEMGAAGTLRKPFEIDELEDVIEHALAGKTN